MAEEALINDDFRSPEDIEVQKKLAGLQDLAHEGALFRDWSTLYCSRKLFKWLDEKISDSKNLWVSATSREEAEAIRLRTQSFTMIKNWIYAQIKAGELAADGVKQLHEEGVTLEGMIKRPPTPK
jgi:hypothetical protein